MKIRPAELTDLSQLSKLFDEYRVFYRKESDVAAAQEYLSERFDNQDSKIFVSEDREGNLGGFTQLYPLFSSTRMKKLWLLNDLYINPDYRGKGISVKLIEAAKDLVRTSGACGMYLETEKTNDIGNKLYPRAGMYLSEDSNFYGWDVE